jgi:hypothetical protein
MIRLTPLTAAALGLLLAAAACENDTVNRPFGNVPVDPLFERYVSMGNSITAGFQSGGINDSTQAQSYAVLLAQSMHSPFFVPLLRRPGCPNPIDSVFKVDTVTGSPTRGKPHRIGNTYRDDTCALRLIPATPPPFVSNVAVPGAEVLDAYANLGPGTNANSLTTFILGGLTQVQAARRADPTFVSVWIGNNDVLGAATRSDSAGDSLRITTVADFQTRYTNLMDSVESIGPQGAILVGVANVTAIPYFSTGATYFAIKAGAVPGVTFPAAFTVSANCAPISSGVPGARGDSALIPFPYGVQKLSLAQAGVPQNLDCADTVAAIVVPAELRRLADAVTAYNAHVSSEATTRGWAYLDPNPTLDSLRAIPTAVRPFPLVGAACSANPFGTAFSCDAVHPSGSTHRLIAQKLRLAINTAYTTAIPPIP